MNKARAIFIKNGDMVDPIEGTLKKQEILIEKGKIAKIMPPGTFKDENPAIIVIDANGKIIVPGFVDMHVHLREPGYEYKETIETGGKAGLAGGFTSLACMPNTMPVNDSGAVTRFIVKQAQDANGPHIYPIAAITQGQKGEMLNDFGDLKDAGAVGISDDGFPVLSSEIMRRAIEYARFHDLTVVSHCEDIALSAGGVMHEGHISTQIGLQGIPSASEEIMVQREISLARLTGCHVHLAHISTAGSLGHIRRAKEENINVTAETAPHYFTLDHRAVIGYDTNTKMNPPLRTETDVAAVRQGLADGVIDAIATDHAPHSSLEKDLEFDKAAFGIIGLETALPLSLELVKDGILSLPDVVKKISTNPAKILGINGGVINEGDPADIAILDPEREYNLKEEDIVSKSKNSPFIDRPLKGINEMTIVEGRIAWARD